MTGYAAGVETMTTGTLIVQRASRRGAFVTAVAAVAVAVSMAASISALTPTFAAVREATTAEAVTAGVAEPAGNVIRPAGGTLHAGDWTVKVGSLAWAQTAEVAAADRLNPEVPPGWEWVTLPVEVSHGLQSTASAPLEVTLMAGRISMSHRYKITEHYPSAKLPDELDSHAIEEGKTAKGNVGWMVPSAARQSGTCLLRVTVGETEALFACGS